MTTSKPLEPMLHKQVPDEEIDYSDIPELGDEFWKNCQAIMPRNKQSIHLRIDADVLQWFRGRGKGYQTLMNSVLRSYATNQQQSSETE